MQNLEIQPTLTPFTVIARSYGIFKCMRLMYLVKKQNPYSPEAMEALMMIVSESAITFPLLDKDIRQQFPDYQIRAPEQFDVPTLPLKSSNSIPPKEGLRKKSRSGIYHRSVHDFGHYPGSMNIFEEDYSNLTDRAPEPQLMTKAKKLMANGNFDKAFKLLLKLYDKDKNNNSKIVPKMFRCCFYNQSFHDITYILNNELLKDQDSNNYHYFSELCLFKGIILLMNIPSNFNAAIRQIKNIILLFIRSTMSHHFNDTIISRNILPYYLLILLFCLPSEEKEFVDSIYRSPYIREFRSETEDRSFKDIIDCLIHFNTANYSKQFVLLRHFISSDLLFQNCHSLIILLIFSSQLNYYIYPYYRLSFNEIRSVFLLENNDLMTLVDQCITYKYIPYKWDESKNSLVYNEMNRQDILYNKLIDEKALIYDGIFQEIEESRKKISELPVGGNNDHKIIDDVDGLIDLDNNSCPLDEPFGINDIRTELISNYDPLNDTQNIPPNDSTRGTIESQDSHGDKNSTTDMNVNIIGDNGDNNISSSDDITIDSINSSGNIDHNNFSGQGIMNDNKIDEDNTIEMNSTNDDKNKS